MLSMYNALVVANGGTTLTIGSGITVRGKNGQIGSVTGSPYYTPANVAVINQGTISADVSGGTITINAQPFSNLGLAQALNGGTLKLNSIWSSSGTLAQSGGTLYLGGNFSLADWGSVSGTNGTIYLSGRLSNTNTTLTLDAASGSWVIQGGAVYGGTIVTTNGASLLVSGSGTLDGVTVNGVLDVGNSMNGASLTVTNGLVLNGTVLVGNPTNSNYGAISFAGSQTLSGDGSVVFGFNASAYNALRVANGGTTLTIGSGITVRGKTGQIGYAASPWGGPANVAVVNQGTISADVSGGTITINAQPFSNLGLMGAANGGQLNVQDLVGNVGQVSLIAGSSLTLNGTYTNNLALNLTTNAMLNLGGAWVNSGSINATNATVSLSGSWTNGGAINAANSTVVSAQPLSNQGTISALQGTLSFTSGLTLNSGTLNFDLNGPSSFGRITVSATANLGGTLSANLLSGYIPTPGSSFPVMTYGSCSGAFSNFTLPSTVGWVVNQGATSFTLGTFLMTQQSHGTIAAAPGQSVYTNGQLVTLTARPYRWYEFVQWNDGSTTNPRLATASLGSGFSATFTNTVPLEQLNIGGATRVAPVGAPVVLLNGQWYSNNVVLATNGTQYSVQLQSSFANASFYYSTDGSDPHGAEPYAGPFNVTAPFSIRAVAYSEDFSQAVESDAVSSVNVTIPAVGSIIGTPQTDLYTGTASVNLTAVPNAGWTFLSWTGDASGTNSNTNVVVDGPKSVGAVFGTGLTTSGSGLVQRQPDLTLYPYGSTVRLTAVPTNATTYFRSWSGDALGQVVNPLNYAVTEPNASINAAFLTLPANTHSLTVLINGDGDVTKTPQQSNYVHNASATLTATPGLGSFFVNWTGDTNSASNPLSVVMNTNKTITAAFRSSAATPPSVTITNPVAGAVFIAPVNIPISASVSAGSVALASVAFYGGTNLLSTVSNAPYTCTWTNAPIGTNLLTAIALDNSGLSATSAPVSITVLPNPPVFLFSATNYAVNENAGSVTLTVLNQGDVAGSVSFQSVNGTAQGGTGFSGDYTITSGNLALGGHQATNISIQILDNFLDRPDIQFQVQLLFPSLGATLGSPATATVTIHENDVGGATNSLLTVALPSPQPPMNGQLVVTLAPPEAGGQWRFPWDLGWRTNGQAVTGLVPGDYPLEFRSLSNYLAYPSTVTVTVPNNGTASYTNQYLPTFAPEGTNEIGSLTVNIGPNAPPGAGWRFLGETAWRNPGANVAGLLPDTYFVEFAPVSGWSKPASLAVQVSGGASMAISVNYLSPASPGSAALPVAVLTNNVTDYAHYPYGFNGQLQTDTRFGSGVAVRPNVVLTAAHLVFEDQTLSYVKQAYWSFQEEAGAFQPEPLLARGWYVLSGYAAQRTNDLQSGVYGLDQSSPASRNLDVAALYFAAPAARSGYGGYLTSDAVPNPWLTGSNLKMLVGYPVDGSFFGQVVQPGTMYVTPSQADSRPFTQLTNQTYAAPWLLSYPGNSGGPVYVQVPYSGGSYYFPAAVYLGTLYSGAGYQSVVRAIDSSVANLINLAASQGDTGTNNTGGGVITITAGGGGGLLAYLQVPIGPPGAVAAGAAWRKYGTTGWSGGPTYTAAIASGGSVTLEFKPIPGWNLPTTKAVQITPGQLTVVSATYTPAASPAPPVLTFNPASGLGITGTTGTTFRLEYPYLAGRRPMVAHQDQHARPGPQSAAPLAADQRPRRLLPRRLDAVSNRMEGASGHHHRNAGFIRQGPRAGKPCRMNPAFRFVCSPAVVLVSRCAPGWIVSPKRLVCSHAPILSSREHKASLAKP